MDAREIEFQKRIKATFRIEAEEHLQALSVGLNDLEKTQTATKIAEIIEVLFREVHSLKGAARSIDQKEIEFVCQPMESIFSALKRKEMDLTPSLLDLFFKTVEWLMKHVAKSETGQSDASLQTRKELITQLNAMVSGSVIVSLPQMQQAKEIKPPFSEKADHVPAIEPLTLSEPEHVTVASKLSLPGQISMVRIPVSKLDPLLMQAEELTQSKIVVDQRAMELRDLCTEVDEWKSEAQKWSRRITTLTTAALTEWYDDSEFRLNRVGTQLELITNSMERDQHNLDLLVNNHLETMKQVLMLPVSSMVETFPGMVREISHKQNKEIEFNITGTELEIDKRILDELKEPLIHLIRNSIDHGIGIPEDRILQNKPARGKITLNFVSQENGQVEVTLSDDGNGINKELVLKAAIKSGTVSKQNAGKLLQNDVLNLIYQSGISTSSFITNISGRGLGLPIVRDRVEKLNGKISVESEAKKGTIFRILLPMTLATFRGIVVKVNEFFFIIPTMNVERVMKMAEKDIKTVQNQETIYINEKIISVIDLRKVLGITEHKNNLTSKFKKEDVNSNQIYLVIIVSGENSIAFKVDEIINEQQVLVKSLGKLLTRVRNISGATILGSGKVVPVLNINDLIKTAIRIKGKVIEVPHEELIVPKTGRILIAEDSITSRTLLKNILETAGYQVTTSVDGADAFAKTRKSEFDLIVSDVDMPKLNGFELTQKIKTDKLREIPVVLLTSLESREDRERGIEVGADAYLIKSSFDQTNLLEIIKKLI
jgi:two-component system chemotaxis sensor kinase CheA